LEVATMTMLMRSDPFRELDRLTQQVFGSNGTLARPSVMPMDAWRDGDTFHVEFDLPGINPDSIDLDVERNVVTVKAERPARDDDTELIAAERPRGIFSRQLILGDNLDTKHISASYDAGVLTLQIPVAEQAKPRKISITSKGEDCADEELLRAEFEAIIAAEWPIPPAAPPPRHPARIPPPPTGTRRPRLPRSGQVSQRPRHPGVGGWARQRSPPPP
jgi:HSP20 family protein